MVRLFRRKKDEEPAGTAEETAQPPGEAYEFAPAPEIEAGEEAHAVDQAVERTRRTWFSRIGGMFRRGLSEELWEELEETLVAADTGVATTMKVIDDLRERVKRESIRDPEQALGVLKEDLIATLEVDTVRGQIWHSNGHRQTLPRPAIILGVGVNGTGKTKGIGKQENVDRTLEMKFVFAAAET